MKNILISMFIVGSFGLLAGCCTDDVGCGSETMYVATNTCSSCNHTCRTCNNTCSTCGAGASYGSYTYGGWY